jgi:ABC-type lipoprotein release transport system permease subunit
MAGGFVLFSISIGFQDGSYGSIIDMFTRTHTGHVQIHRKGYLDKPTLHKGIDHPDELQERILEMPGVEALTPRVHFTCLALFQTKTSGAKIIGIDPRKEASAMRIEPRVADGRYLSAEPSHELILGRGLADVLNVAINDEISLIGQGADGSIPNDNFTVVGIFSKSGSAYDHMSCYVHIDTTREFLLLGDRVHEIAIILDDQDRSRTAAAGIDSELADESLDIQPWETVERQFYQAMIVDKRGGYITLGIIMLIVAIGVLNTVLMSILERTKEFGVIRAIGTRPSSVFTLILTETAFLAAFSIIVGAAAAALLNHYFSIHGIRLSQPLQYGGVEWDRMLSIVSFRTFWLPALVTFLAAVVVSVFPALRAAHVTPVKAMRYN